MNPTIWRVARDRQILPAHTCRAPTFEWISCPWQSDFGVLQSMSGLSSCGEGNVPAQLQENGDTLHRRKGRLRRFGTGALEWKWEDVGELCPSLPTGFAGKPRNKSQKRT
jgi:hypothetical protein